MRNSYEIMDLSAYVSDLKEEEECAMKHDAIIRYSRFYDA